MNTVADAVTKEFKVDTTKGHRDGTVSSQWYGRPDDQRFTSLYDLNDFLTVRDSHMIEETKTSRFFVTEYEDDLLVPHEGEYIKLNNWSFTQMCNMIGAPSSYLQRLPARLAAENINHGFNVRNTETTAIYYDQSDMELKSITSPTYGRVMDSSIVAAAIKIAGSGTGEARWKVPGAIDWSKGTYNPFVDITKDTTTLYASDRDVFLFLVDDRNPIEIGKLANGSPDYVFRGFYVWNSEVGSKTMGISTFFLRGVCQNRNLWGVQDQTTKIIRHTKSANTRLLNELEPALIEYANSSGNEFVHRISNAKSTRIATTTDDALLWLTQQGFTKGLSQKIIDKHIEEESFYPTSVWDMTQGITALARSITNSDVRIELEKRAAKLLNKAAV